MVNHLEDLCEKREIKVEFITYNFIDGAIELKYSEPVIRVHKIFKECSMKVATAIVEIFTGEGNTTDSIDIIENYLNEKFGPVGIKIQPPKVLITRPNRNAESSSYNCEEKLYSSEEEMYIEADISFINITNIRGQQKKIYDNEALMAKERDILELDIIVKPPIYIR